MRSSLAPLRGKRARFIATFAGVSKGGNILLRDLQGPAGHEDHVWVPSRRWPGKIMLPETEFDFTARVGAYTKLSGSWEFGLLDIEIEGPRR